MLAPPEAYWAHENAGHSASLISPKQPHMKAPQLRVREPSTWDSKSFLMGIGQGGATSSSVRSGNQAGSAGSGWRVSLKLAPPWSCIKPVAIFWSEDVSVCLSSGEWDREKNSWQCTFSLVMDRSTSAPCRGSKSSKPTLGATSTLLEESPSSKACPPHGSGDRGCALLWWRGSDNLPIAEDSLHVCTEPWSEWWLIYKTTDVLSVWISTCCCSSCGRKYFRVKKTASSSKQFCNTGSEVLTLATKPSDTAPRTRVDASVVTTTHDVSWHHGLRASMLPRETALRKRPEVHAVQLTLF